jgi:cytidylate kinase
MPIITISRQPGSYGPQVAQALADRLGLEVIRRSRLHQLAQACDPEYENACRLYERETFSGFFERMMIDRPAYRSLFEALHYELASKGNVVILGRGGHIVLKDVSVVVRVRLVADQSVRLERIMAQKKINREEAENFLDHFSRRHKAMIRAIFDQDVEKPIDYDIVLNTARLTAEQAAETVSQFVKIKQNERQPDVDKDFLWRMALVKRLETIIRKKVYIAPYRTFGISMPNSGEVHLHGVVEHRQDIRQIEEIVAGVDGVESVKNNLRAFAAPPA